MSQIIRLTSAKVISNRLEEHIREENIKYLNENIIPLFELYNSRKIIFILRGGKDCPNITVAVQNEMFNKDVFVIKNNSITLELIQKEFELSEFKTQYLNDVQLVVDVPKSQMTPSSSKHHLAKDELWKIVTLIKAGDLQELSAVLTEDADEIPGRKWMLRYLKIAIIRDRKSIVKYLTEKYEYDLKDIKKLVDNQQPPNNSTIFLKESFL